ncbi:MAG: type I polyketide synthase [Methylococcales bacterium]|nr:type I polyketide synthase [Methylococcales bacterium]
MQQGTTAAISSNFKSVEQSPIAIIGMGCRFPDANNPTEFWSQLVGGHNAIKEIPTSRWNASDFPQIHTPRAGLLDTVDLFDAEFFGISDKEADSIDPQQRLILEVSYEALENAGIAPESLAQSETGVFVGISTDDYVAWQFGSLDKIDAYASTGKTFSIAANRLSYILDLRAPSLAIDTACSSSLVAVHQACQSLREQECSLALAAGVNLILSPQIMIALSAANMLSPTGQCKTFSADADGYVRGEGCGVVVLKRLADAERDGDSVLAVIRGSAINQDGRSNGLTAPNLSAQQNVIKKALANARVKPETVSYIETHGTGTPLGDPIEMDALLSVFNQAPKLNVGSVKTNIGHLEAASGVAGLIKVVQMLRHQTIPAHLHCETRNPLIKLDDTGFNISSKTQPWEVEQRIAGISSFGFGGTNAHIVLSEAKNTATATENSDTQVFTVSAKSEAALKELLQSYFGFIEREGSKLKLANLCYSAALGRSAFAYRASIVAVNLDDLRQRLQDEIQQTHSAIAKEARKIAFLFTGQGSQTKKMGLQLYQSEPIFKVTLDACAELLKDELPLPLIEVMFNDDDSLLNQTGYTQPLLFSLQYALAKLWESWGVKPDILLGHSVGEYALACLAGVFDLPDAIKLIAARGRLMQALPANGGMAAVFADFETVSAALKNVQGNVVIAGYNSPRLHVISGEKDALDAVCENLWSQGFSSQTLAVSHAFHSPLMQEMLGEFADVARRCNYRQPNIAIVSSLTGKRIDAEMSTADYWVQHIIEPVRFSDAVNALLAENCHIAIEIGAQPHASSMAQQSNGAENVQWLPSLKRGANDRDVLLNAVAKLFQQGVTLDWRSFYSVSEHQRITNLPNYPFQRQRYWLDTLPTFAQSHLPQTEKSPQLYYQWHWQVSPLVATEFTESQTWLIFADKTGVATKLAEALILLGHQCHLVFAGQTNRALSSGLGWEIEPSISGLNYLQTMSLPTTRVIHLWSLDLKSDLPNALSEQTLSCFSVMHILQKLSPESLWLITRNASIQPNQALLRGMAKVVALEYPKIFKGQIDLSDDVDISSLVAELNAKNIELAVSLKGNQRYVGRLLPYELTQDTTEFKANSTYLISGGLGALGLQIAKSLAEKGAKNLVLLARRAAGKEHQTTLNELKQLGCSVHTLQADVSLESDMKRVAAELENLPPLRGIIHAAGVAADKPLAQLTEEDFYQVLQAKVQGACLLHELSLNFELDFFCLLSSIAAIWGAKERAAYAAANHFLDALSAYRQHQKLPAISLNLGAWQGEGMAVDLEHELAQSGIQPLNPKQILNDLPRILVQPISQLIIIDANWATLSELFSGYAGADLFEHLCKIKTKKQPSLQTDSFFETLRRTPKNQQSTLLSERLKIELSDTLGLKNNKTIDVERGFFEMGMDSLMAVQFRVRLNNLFNLHLPATLAFDYPNIQHLTVFLLNQLAHTLTVETKNIDTNQLNEEIEVELCALENLLRDEG